MNNFVFLIIHHSNNEKHLFILDRCVKSIREIYNNSRIIICKTSVSVVSDEFIEKYNVEINNTLYDGLHVYGGINLIVNDSTINNYILIHDSMILLKELPNEILGKNFYSLWDFSIAMDLTEETLKDYLLDTNLDENKKNNILSTYKNNFPHFWRGIFGPAFGGNRETLTYLWKTLNINENNYHKYLGRNNIMNAERYIALMAYELKLLNNFSYGYSLNGSIFDQPHGWNNDSINYLTLEEIKKLNCDKYLFKTWMSRL
jgi:hypothetical protein